MKKILIQFSIFLVFGFGMTHCVSDFNEDLGYSCVSDSDCLANWLCSAGRCVRPTSGTDATDSETGDSCRLPNADGIVQGQECVSPTCDEGFANCNDDDTDGCEVDLRSDSENCGECDRDCDFEQNVEWGASCVSSACVYDCSTGWADCDSASGCEAKLGTSVNCTACGDACASDERCASTCVPLVGYSRIPAGSFPMGSPTTELGRELASEVEQIHGVTLTRPFLIKTMEVKQSEWEQVMGNNPSVTTVQPNHPVNSISWEDALAFCNALSEADGLETCYDLSSCSGTPGVAGTFLCTDPIDFSLDCRGYRLPTEAEWEYATRAGSTTALFNGDLTVPDGCSDPMLGEIAWFTCNSGNQTHPVGSKPANQWGMRDTNGNIGEFVWDWFAAYPATLQIDPKGPVSGTQHILRGGTAFTQAALSRSASRPRIGENHSPWSGFRPVKWSD